MHFWLQIWPSSENPEERKHASHPLHHLREPAFWKLKDEFIVIYSTQSLTVPSSSNCVHGQPIHSSNRTYDRSHATLSFYCFTAYKVLEKLISRTTKVIVQLYLINVLGQTIIRPSKETAEGTKNKKVMIWQTTNKNTKTWTQLRKRKFWGSFLSHNKTFPRLYLKYVDSFIPYVV